MFVLNSFLMSIVFPLSVYWWTARPSFEAKIKQKKKRDTIIDNVKGSGVSWMTWWFWYCFTRPDFLENKKLATSSITNLTSGVMPSQVLFLLKRTPTMQSHAAQKEKLDSEKWTTCWVGNWEWFWGNHFCNIWIFNWKMSGNWSRMKRGMMRKWCAYLGGWNRMGRTTRKYSFRNHVTSSPTTRKKRNFLWTHLHMWWDDSSDHEASVHQLVMNAL